MSEEQAFQIAFNFYRHQFGEEPSRMYVKYVEPDSGSICIWSEEYDVDLHETFYYEIMIEPSVDEITLKKVLMQYGIKDFQQTPVMLSTLKQGDLFRLEGDRVKYEYHKPINAYGSDWIGISRKGKADIDLVSDQLVFPFSE